MKIVDGFGGTARWCRAGLCPLYFFHHPFAPHTRDTEFTEFSNAKNNLPPEKGHRLKQTWIALKGKKERVRFFHKGLSIYPNVPPLGLPLCGGCKR